MPGSPGSSVWPAYFKRQAGRPPRDSLLRVLEAFADPGFAVDLGCGSGIETIAMLERGWSVLAVDAHPEGIATLEAAVPEQLRPALTTRVDAFERLESLPPADLVHAGYSLPFCAPEAFPHLWSVIREAVRPGGRVACEIFGPHDTWAAEPSMNAHDRGEIERMAAGLEIELLDEDEHDGDSLRGPKRWHIFTLVARRPPEA